MKNEDLLYEEVVGSRKTQILFSGLTLLFLSLSWWRIDAGRSGGLVFLFLFLGVLFLFYVLNYRILLIRLTAEQFILRFGVFSWKVPVCNIEDCRLDDNIPAIKKYGGAGIHFMSVHRRFRVSFNFLEHPRVVVALKRRRGPVRDVSFSTCQPDRVVKAVRKAIAVGVSGPTGKVSNS